MTTYTVTVENKYFTNEGEFSAASETEAIAAAKAAMLHAELPGKLKWTAKVKEVNHA